MDLIYFFIEEVNHPCISKLRLIMNHRIRDSEKSSLNFSLNLTSMLCWPWSVLHFSHKIRLIISRLSAAFPREHFSTVCSSFSRELAVSAIVVLLLAAFLHNHHDKFMRLLFARQLSELYWSILFNLILLSPQFLT